jgi:hypothetical protein
MILAFAWGVSDPEREKPSLQVDLMSHQSQSFTTLHGLREPATTKSPRPRTSRGKYR